MFLWLLTEKTSFCNPTMACAQCQELAFNMVVAAVYIYCYVNVCEGHTRLRYCVYYCVVYLENMAMCLLWFVSANTRTMWYLQPAFALILFGFFIGIIFQLTYYKFFHPNNYEPYSRYKRIKTCLTIDELLNRPPTPPSPVQHNSVPSHVHAQRDDVNNHTAALSMQV